MESDKISWNPGRNITKQTVKVIKVGKHNKKATKKETKKLDSFFNIFVNYDSHLSDNDSIHRKSSDNKRPRNKSTISKCDNKESLI